MQKEREKRTTVLEDESGRRVVKCRIRSDHSICSFRKPQLVALLRLVQITQEDSVPGALVAESGGGGCRLGSSAKHDYESPGVPS